MAFLAITGDNEASSFLSLSLSLSLSLPLLLLPLVLSKCKDVGDSISSYSVLSSSGECVDLILLLQIYDFGDSVTGDGMSSCSDKCVDTLLLRLCVHKLDTELLALCLSSEWCEVGSV